jgi:hypothetical protein
VESECEPETHPLEKSCKATGEAARFESLPPVGIADFTTQRVAPEEVTLKAKLSPNNGLNTEYTVSYGEDASCSSASLHHELEGVLGNEFKGVIATFELLKPNTEYHFCLEATNSYGEPVRTADQTFTTEETLAEQDAREGCSNQLRREENDSTALPDCRAYEQVSPALKQGYPAFGSGLSPSGERVAYTSTGAFAGAQANEVVVEYTAQRNSLGWSTVPVISHPGGSDAQVYQATDYSGGFDRWLFSTLPGLSTLGAKQANTSQTLYLGSADAPALQAAPALTPTEGGEHPGAFLSVPYGQSEDLSTLFLATGFPFLGSDSRPGPSRPSERKDRIYAIQGAGGPSPTLSLAAELPPNLATSVECSIEPGLIDGGSWQRSASGDGSELFYQAPVEVEAGKSCGSDGPNKYAVFACRIAAGPCVAGQPGYHEAVRLSAPPATECHSPSPCASAPLANAQYRGASPDGRFVWFTTARPLIDSDVDETSDLYLAKLTEAGQLEGLVQVSAGEAGPEHPVPGAGAGVIGVVKVSGDGTHVAFVASGVLSTEPNPTSGQAAAAGAENLYVYDGATEQLRFVARLCSGPGLSGSLPDQSCASSLPKSEADSSLAQSGEPQAAFTQDGNFLLFGSYGQLTSGDTDAARDLYRFDFQTGDLVRVSIGRRGNDANGNDNAFDAEILRPVKPPWTQAELAEDFTRAISADGSTVVFHTAAPLVSRDTDEGAQPGCASEETGCDVYEWSEDGRGNCREAGGCLSLVSSGVAVHGAQGGVVSASGRDISFVTAAGLAPSDTDGVGDIYDAREGGGFPFAPPPKMPCQEGSPEACHGESTREVLKPAYTSEGTQSGGNGPQRLQCAKGRHKVKRRGQVRCVPNKAKHNNKRAHHHKKRAARHNLGGRK